MSIIKRTLLLLVLAAAVTLVAGSWSDGRRTVGFTWDNNPHAWVSADGVVTPYGFTWDNATGSAPGNGNGNAYGHG